MRRPFARLLGAPVLTLGSGRCLPLAAERRYQLLGFLARCRRWVTRDEVAELLWEREHAMARSNLRNVIMQLRRGGIEHFETDGELLRFDAATDVEIFETAIAARQWGAALDAYTGSLLEGFDANASRGFVEWLSFERARLDARWRDAVSERLTDLRDDAHACATVARRALDFDPLNETALAAYLGAQARLGARTDAQRAWQVYVARLAEEHGVEPSAHLRNLAEGLTPETAHTVVAVERASPAPDYIGRRLELLQIRELLAEEHCRLLTVTGPGGVGKTTLARAAAACMDLPFADAITWVALEDLTRTEEVAARLARAIGVQLCGPAAPLSQVVRHLGAARRLLVFDNAEHLDALDRVVTELLDACPQLKILITSRVRLGIAREWLFPVEGLPVPDRDEQDIEVLRRFDAIKLFELRARAISPHFRFAEQARDVVELALAVEGLPLALELAAACTRVSPVRDIVREIMTNADFLELGGKTSGRTLRAAFEHSWRLLAPAERAALARLAVFRGGFTREAAFDVADAALPVLAALADKSMLRIRDERFDLHPLIHQYAREKLALEASASLEGLRARHAQWYFAHLRRNDGSRGVGPLEKFNAVTIERENVLAAWHTFIDRADAAAIERAVPALGSFHATQGRLREAAALFHEASERLAGHATCVAQLRAHEAWSLLWMERYDTAEETAQVALDATKGIRNEAAVIALRTLAHLARRRGRHQTSARLLAQALQCTAQSRLRHLRATLLDALAMAYNMLGKFDAARHRIEDAVILNEAAGNELQRAYNDFNLSQSYSLAGQAAQALPWAEAACTRAQRTGYRVFEPYARCELAHVLCALGKWDSAKAQAHDALQLSKALQDRAAMAWAYEVQSSIALGRHDFETARAALAAGAALCREADNVLMAAPIIVVTARLFDLTGQRNRALDLLRSLIASDVVAQPVREQAQALITSWDAEPGDGRASRAWLCDALDEIARGESQHRDAAFAEPLN